MYIQRLKVTTFRNIPYADIDTNNAPIIALYGKNGAGKTNMLEALSLLSPGTGLHRAKREEQIQQDASSWAIHCQVQTDEPHTIGMLYGKSKRHIKIDNEPADGQTSLSDIGNVIWFTPRMDRLFHDAAQPRREFLDRLVFGLIPSHADVMTRYKHHLKARLKLIKTEAMNDWIELEEQQAAAYALQMVKNRHTFLNQLKEHMPEVSLDLTGKADLVLDENEPLAAMQARFKRSRERDFYSGSNQFGPQRSDLTGLLLPENIPLNRCSTGQHKRAIMDILLANAKLMHATTGSPPIILMDEITSHLDTTARARLFNSFTELGTQIWMTGTEEDLFEGLENVLKVRVTSGNFETISNT